MIAESLSLPKRFLYLVLLLPASWALYKLEDWRNDRFLVSGGYAIDVDRKPLGMKETRRQVELAGVQNIRTEQCGLLPLLFHYGNVILVTAGGASDAVFENVARPWAVQKELFRLRERELRRCDEAKMKERRSELTRFAEALGQLQETS